MNPPKIVVVQGISSGYQVEIDIQTVVDLCSSFFKDAPRESRALLKVVSISTLHDSLQRLLAHETKKNLAVIEETVRRDLTQRLLDQDDIELISNEGESIDVCN